MIKVIFYFSLLLMVGKIQAQNVGIGTNTPDASAKLEVQSADKGVLVPRISIPNLSAAAPVITPATSLLVYNTNTATGLGYYYWDGTQWLKLLSQEDTDHDWYEIGTTRAPDDINDRIYTQNRVSIGTTTSNAQLNIGGSQTLNFIGTAPSSSISAPGSLIINANSGAANITPRFEEFRFNGFDAGTASTVNIIGIDVAHTALTLGLRTGQTRNVMQIVDAANLPVTVFDEQGRLGIGTGAPAGSIDARGSNLFYLGVNDVGQRIIGSDGSKLYMKPPVDGNLIRLEDGNTTNALEVVVASSVNLRVNTPTNNGGDLTITTDPVAGDDGDFMVNTGATSTERLRIKGNGKVGVGINAPAARLHVASGGNGLADYTAKFTSSPSVAGGGGIAFTNTEAGIATGFKIHTTGTGVGTYTNDNFVLSSVGVASGVVNQANLLNILGDGRMGFSTTANTGAFIRTSTGASLSNGGAWTNSSDRRLKTNISNSKYGLATVLSLRPVDYTMLKGKEKQVGFIAQEVQKIVPEAVYGIEGDLDKQETLSLSYDQLVPVLVNAVKEQQQLLTTQSEVIKALQERVETLEHKNKQ